MQRQAIGTWPLPAGMVFGEVKTVVHLIREELLIAVTCPPG